LISIFLKASLSQEIAKALFFSFHAGEQFIHIVLYGNGFHTVIDVITLEFQCERLPPIVVLYGTYLYLARSGLLLSQGGGCLGKPEC
jgi:hypothetical protein